MTETLDNNLPVTRRVPPPPDPDAFQRVANWLTELEQLVPTVP